MKQARDTVGMRLVTDSLPRDAVGSIGMRLVTDSQLRDTVGSIGMRPVTDSQLRDTVGSIGMRLVTDSQPLLQHMQQCQSALMELANLLTFPQRKGPGRGGAEEETIAYLVCVSNQLQSHCPLPIHSLTQHTFIRCYHVP